MNSIKTFVHVVNLKTLNVDGVSAQTSKSFVIMHSLREAVIVDSSSK